jgi:Na+/melibiose symporter-like transporter
MHRIRVLAQVAIGCVLAFAAIVVAEHAFVPRLGLVDHMTSEYANAGGVAGAAAVVALLAWSISLLAAALLVAHSAAREGARGLWAAAAAVMAALILGPTLAALSVGARGLRQRVLIAAACAWELGLVSTLRDPRRLPPPGRRSGTRN